MRLKFNLYLIPLTFLLAFSFFHLYSLPIVISYDSQLYIDQALMLGSKRFWTDWHFLRTPLFQIITRLSFILFGERSWVLAGITTIFGLLGLILLQKTLQRFVSQWNAWLIVIVVSLMPLFITYQHAFLTESGSFMLITLITLTAVNTYARRFSTRSTLFHAMVLTMAFYFRPTLLVLCVTLPLAYALFHAPHSFKKLMAICLVTVVVPYAATIPWKALGRNIKWEGDQITFGLINQAVFSPANFESPKVNKKYCSAIENSLVDGHLSMSGIKDGEIYQFIGLLGDEVNDHPFRYFLKTIYQNPFRYLKGVVRGMLHLMGVPGVDSDNDVFKTAVFENSSNVILAGPPSINDHIVASFSGTVRGSSWAKRLSSLDQLYKWLYRIGAFLLPVVMVLACVTNRGDIFILSCVPFIFLFYHAVVLFSLDRMSAPVAPIVVSMPLLLMYYLAGLFKQQSLDSDR